MKIALKIYVYKNVLKREMGDDRGNIIEITNYKITKMHNDVKKLSCC
jgi:hypothetical protein